MQFSILITLREGSMYGYSILKSLRERFQGAWEPRTGALYPALQRLQEHGLVETETIDGHEHYRLTTEGDEWLRENVQKLADKAHVGLRFASMILEAYDSMGFDERPMHSSLTDTDRDEALSRLKEAEAALRSDLEAVRGMMEAMEEGRQWEQ